MDDKPPQRGSIGQWIAVVAFGLAAFAAGTTVSLVVTPFGTGGECGSLLHRNNVVQGDDASPPCTPPAAEDFVGARKTKAVVTGGFATWMLAVGFGVRQRETRLRHVAGDAPLLSSAA